MLGNFGIGDMHPFGFIPSKPKNKSFKKILLTSVSGALIKVTKKVSLYWK
jgi:hypothetical protein